MNHRNRSRSREMAIAQRPGGGVYDCAAGWLLLALVVLLAGCAPSASGAPSPAAPSVTPSTWTVIGIDRSGSYSFLEPGRQLALAAVRDARPGDTIVVRWISDNSYRNAEFALRYTAPNVAVRDCANRYDATCRRENLAAKLAEQQARDGALAQVRDLRVASASNTDITGFLLAATEVLASAPPGATRQVWLATDLLDNVRRYQLPVNLAGARVFVRGLQNEDPERSMALRAEWQERLTAYGASEVRFESAEVTP